MPFAFHTPIPEVSFVEIPVSGITTNIYVVGPPGQALLVDCGGAGSAAEVIATLEAGGCGPDGVRAMAVTHGHLDHYGGAGALAAWSGAPVWAHPGAAVEIEDHWGDFIVPGSSAANSAPDGWEGFRAGAGRDVRVERMLREGDAVEGAGRRLEVLHTPGHQRGLITLFEPERRLAFVGDLIQGGADCSANWLGLFTDVEGQRRSLKRVGALAPEWLFKAHRAPRSGADVAADLAAAAGRLEAIESALLEELQQKGQLSPAEAARAAFREVLGMAVVEPLKYAELTAEAFLIDLARRGRARRRPDLDWELVS